jgi:hypothetical protein
MHLRSLLPLLLLAAAVAAQPSYLRLPPLADATTNQDQPATNYGTSPDLDFGKDFTQTPTFRVWFTRGHLRFDLAPIASLPRPLRARLWWNQERARTTPAGCLPVSVHRVTASWNEAMVTWTTNPPFDASIVVRESVGGWDCSGWHVFDVTPLVHGWLDNRWPNDGLLIRDETEITAGAARPGKGHSRESANASLRPYLELSWAVAYGTGCAPTTPLPVLDLTSGSPQVNSSFTMTGSYLFPSWPSVLHVGFSNRSWLGLNLPFPLGAIGFPNCSILASGEVGFPRLTSASGGRLDVFTIPDNPTLRGLDLYLQAIALQPTPGLAMSNGFALRVY